MMFALFSLQVYTRPAGGERAFFPEARYDLFEGAEPVPSSLCGRASGSQAPYQFLSQAWAARRSRRPAESVRPSETAAFALACSGRRMPGMTDETSERESTNRS